MAEGAPLLREYTVYSRIEGSNPSLTAMPSCMVGKTLYIAGANCALVAQLDRVPGYEPGGRRFESSRARQFRLTAVKLDKEYSGGL